MNYLELINQFWRARRTKKMTSNEADLYYFLLQECNLRGWVNPFDCPNTLITAMTGLSNKSLVCARSALKQKGLIDFQGGIRRAKTPFYEILVSVETKNETKTEPKTPFYDVLVSTETKNETKNGGKTGGKTGTKTGHLILNKTKTKTKKKGSMSGDNAPAGATHPQNTPDVLEGLKQESDPVNDCATQAQTCGKATTGTPSRERLRNAGIDLRQGDDGNAAFKKRKNDFMNDCATYVSTYGREMIRAFFDYWTEPNKSNTRMRFELERTWDLNRRLKTWENNELKFKKNGTKNRKGIADEELLAAVASGITRAERDKAERERRTVD
jgi:hypothetical protein